MTHIRALIRIILHTLRMTMSPALAAVLAILTGCSPSRPPLLPALTQEQRREILESPQAPAARPAQAPRAEPQVPPGLRKTISLNCRDTPAAPVLQGLAAQTGTDLHYRGPASLRLSYRGNGELGTLLEDICALNNLRLTVTGNRVVIEEDTPYPHMYNVQFLNLTRNSHNKTSIAGNVFSEYPGTGTAGASGSPVPLRGNTAHSEFHTEGSSDFWQEMRANLELIVPKEAVTFHRQAGLITVLGNRRQQEHVRAYLDELRRCAAAQVLIEAKIIEVSLHEEFKSGINWHALSGSVGLSLDAPLAKITHEAATIDGSGGGTDTVTFGRVGRNFTGIVSALERFGTVRTISSPRLTALNNQCAVIKVAQNQVYFRLNYDKQYGINANRDSISVSSDIQTVPIGLTLSVQPAVDSRNREVILFLRPSISKLSRSVADPAVDIAMQQSSREVRPSLVPVVEVREIESVLRLKDRETAVVGGLMEVRASSDRAQLPGAEGFTSLGRLFAASENRETVVELVILLRVFIADADDNTAVAPDPADRRLQGYVPQVR